MNKPITLCDRCEIAVRCLLNYDGVPCRKNRTVEPTNADHIRAMSDEELSKLLNSNRHGCVAIYDKTYCCPHALEKEPDCEKCWLDWLKQEVN